MSHWARLRQHFWFLPAVLCALATVLAETLIFLDQRLGEVDLGPVGVLITRVGESGSRDLLGAVAGSMLTVASTTFSITIAVLALSSSTYGPRLVRNFMADRGNQFVLGVFVATFLYSLLVLRSIRVLDDGSGEYFVPHLAINMAVLLAVLAIGVLVYFIHHISDSVQVWTLAQQVRADLLATVDRLYSEQIGCEPPDFEEPEGAKGTPHRLDTDGFSLAAHETGYVQSVDHEEIVALACKHDVVVSLRIRPGSHVIEGAALGALWPPGQVNDALLAKILKSIRVGRARTPHEDVAFSALLLEEMAVRALSSGTNDPYTAINALDDLSAGLVRLAGRRTPSKFRYDPQGNLRVVAPVVTLTDLLDHLLDAMRLYAIEHPSVVHRTLELVEQVGAASKHPSARARMDKQVQRLVEAFALSSPQGCDLEELRRHADRVGRSLVGSNITDCDEQ
ncbi:MAG: DUF2254 domain-containing protein [Nocardioidaceae bacterium]|nr:DUF2254 domain-containing protein [Nocardioidaceae bacterium]